MGIIEAVPVADIGKGNLWVIYGRSGTGKTTLAGTFPKPALLLQIGDDGVNSISDVKDLFVYKIESIKSFLEVVLKELERDKKYQTVIVDTFGFIINEWTEQKNKRLTLQDWGDLKADTESIIRKLRGIADTRNVVLTCGELTDSYEGLEGEIAPDIRPNVSKGVRNYLEGMANYGIHTTILQKEDNLGNIQTRHAIHLAPNAYYWTKVQKPMEISLPAIMSNPTYDKIMKIVGGIK